MKGALVFGVEVVSSSVFIVKVDVVGFYSEEVFSLNFLVRGL